MEHYFYFAFLMAVGQYSPGPDMLLIMKNTLNHGRRAGMFTVAGICCGICIHTLAALAGLQLVFRAWPGAYVGLRIAGAAYIAYLGVRLLLSLRKTTSNRELQGQEYLQSRDSFVQGFVTNILNVKVMVLFSSLIAVFMDKEAPGSTGRIYGAIIIGQGIVLWIVFVLLLDHKTVRKLFLRWERVTNAVFGILLLALALTVVWGVIEGRV